MTLPAEPREPLLLALRRADPPAFRREVRAVLAAQGSVSAGARALGVREATFGFYFARLGLPLESALLVSFMGAALIMLFSLSGGIAYLVRRREHSSLPADDPVDEATGQPYPETSSANQ